MESVGAAVRGLNHITLAVSALQRSISFYRDLLGLDLRAHWAEGAYLDAGALWLCLSCDARVRTSPHPDYSHVAFDVDAAAFEVLRGRIEAAAPLWKTNRSEGASLYFLDPDGHKLELHVGSLQSRLAHYRAEGTPGIVIDGTRI